MQRKTIRDDHTGVTRGHQQVRRWNVNDAVQYVQGYLTSYGAPCELTEPLVPGWSVCLRCQGMYLQNGEVSACASTGAPSAKGEGEKRSIIGLREGRGHAPCVPVMLMRLQPGLRE